MRTAAPVPRRRSWAQRGVLAAAAALAFVTGGVAAGLAGYIAVATDDGVRTTLAAGSIADTVYQVSGRGGDDLAAADAAVTDRLAEVLPDVAYHLHRSVITGPRSLYAGAGGRAGLDDEAEPDDENDDESAGDSDEDADGADSAEDDASGVVLARGVFASYEDMADHADIVAGRWPGAAGEHTPVAVHAGPAAGLGLAVGDVVSVSDRGQVRSYEIVGLWLPADPDDPFWYGQELETEGADSRVDVLLVAAVAALAEVPGASLISRWRLAPDLSALGASDVAALRTTLPRVSLRLDNDVRLRGTRVSVEDGLLAALRDSDDRIQAARSVAVVPLIVLGLVGVITVSVVARMLTAVRRAETALLRARGSSVTRLTRWSLVEALIVTVVPAGLGAVAAAGVLVLTTGITPATTVLGAGAAAAAVLIVATLTVAGFRSARIALGATVEQPAAAHRSRRVLRAGSLALVLAAAGVGLWQLHRQGAPAVITGGGSRIDPVTVSAPALALLAGGVLGAVAVTAIAWASQSIVRRRANLSGTLAIRQIARRPAGFAVPVILLVVATGSATLAAGFAATWSDLQRDVAGQRTGADLQVVLQGGGSISVDSLATDLAAYRAVPGVEAVHPVIHLPRAAVSDGAVEVIATSRDSVDRDLLAGPELPGGASEVEIELTVTTSAYLDEPRLTFTQQTRDDIDDPEGGVQVDLWLMDDDGRAGLARAVVGGIPADGEPHTVTAVAGLPDGTAPWRLVAIDLGVDGGASDFFNAMWDYDYKVELTEVRSIPGARPIALGTAWSLMDGTVTGGGPELSATGPLGIRVVRDDEDHWAGRLTARLLADEIHSEPVSLTATDATLGRFGLSVGDEASLSMLGAAVPVRIDRQVGTIAGTTGEHVVTADLRELSELLVAINARIPAVNHVWVDLADEFSDDPATTAAVARVAGDAQILDRIAMEAELRGNVFAGLSLVTFWVVSGAGLVLALLGLAVAAAVLAAQRRGEVPVLRAMGLNARQQARTRRREQIAVSVLGVVLGAAVGLVVTALAVGPLAGAATPTTVEALRPALRIDLVPWLGYLAAGLVGGLIVAVAVGARVRSAASVVTIRGEEI